MRDRSHLGFAVTLVVTAAVALLPAGWRMGWSREVAQIVRFPLRPFSHAGSVLGEWLRPPRSPAEGVPAEARDLVEALIEDRDVAERLFQAEHQRVLELEEENRQLKKIPSDVLGAASRLVNASISGRSPASALGVVELKLERGAASTVPAGTVAVYRGVHLLGRTVGEASAGTYALLPIASPASEPVRAVVYPAEARTVTLEETVPVHLVQTGTGSFTGEVDRTLTLAEGDVVRLVDPGWPRTAQMMLLGTVTALSVNDREPLRHTIIVEPAYQVREVAAVTLFVEETMGGRR